MRLHLASSPCHPIEHFEGLEHPCAQPTVRAHVNPKRLGHHACHLQITLTFEKECRNTRSENKKLLKTVHFIRRRPLNQRRGHGWCYKNRRSLFETLNDRKEIPLQSPPNSHACHLVPAEPQTFRQNTVPKATKH